MSLINKLPILFSLVFTLVFALIFLSAFFPGTIGATEGSQIGIITSVEHNSNLIWAADLAYVKTSARSSQEDVYCVNDAAVKAMLEEFSKNHDSTVIYYKNNYVMWKWQCNGGESIIYKVENSSAPIQEH